ncbi:hypothetical protein HNR10_000578 [Nocardiopsis aegyptia]|uniref:Uncharacterized protein n=1 Tax=Nocardiopsis aegyptia TaxID=220378 RepID=A0A7Z0EIQ6_9ACTN|nr:hypothetical protein [Nocardiopsis aegyptia]
MPVPRTPGIRDRGTLPATPADPRRLSVSHFLPIDGRPSVDINADVYLRTVVRSWLLLFMEKAVLTIPVDSAFR